METLEKLKMSTSKRSASVFWNLLFLFLFEGFPPPILKVIIENSEDKMNKGCFIFSVKIKTNKKARFALFHNPVTFKVSSFSVLKLTSS